MNRPSFATSTALLALMFLAGCAGTPERRHSPADIARYQPADFSAAIASAEGERAAYASAAAKIALAVSPDPAADANVDEALRAISFLNTGREHGRGLMLRALNGLDREPAERQRAVLAEAFTLYAADVAPVLDGMLERFATPREFAIAAYTLLKAGATAERKARIAAAMRARFPDWAAEPRLIALDHALSRDALAELRARPPLADLLAAPFRSGYPVVFSFQRRDRERFGLAMVRGADGRFARKPDGSYFTVPHLALARTSLPGTITNGNTPQGVFTVVGAGTATNPWIGPTPYLESKVPIEATVAEFEHAALAGEWNAERYESFLPASWRGYFPMKEAWLAGLAGRNEMLLHGTTINPEYHRDANFYPGTPSAGCLVAMEYWSPEGRLVHSDQLALAKAFTAGGQERGYLVVVELDDRSQAVTLADVIGEVIAAEARTRVASR